MSINKKSLRYILYTFPVFLLIIFPLIMGCIVYSINLNSKQLDTNKSLIEYVNDYLPFNASYNDNPSLPVLSYESFYKYILENTSAEDYFYLNRASQFTISSDTYNPIFNNNTVTSVGPYYFPLWRVRTVNSGDYRFDLLYTIYNDYISSRNFDGLDTFLYNIGIVDYDIYTYSPVNYNGFIARFRATIDNYVSLVSSFQPFTIEYNNTPIESILSDVYLNLFNNLVLPTSSNLGLPYYLFNYMFYVLGIFILYILFIFFIYVPKCLVCLLDKSIDKLSGGDNL